MVERDDESDGTGGAGEGADSLEGPVTGTGDDDLMEANVTGARVVDADRAEPTADGDDSDTDGRG